MFFVAPKLLLNGLPRPVLDLPPIMPYPPINTYPLSHSVVLNIGPLDWQSSAVTTRPLLYNKKEKYNCCNRMDYILPAPSAACLAGACPDAAIQTFPM